MKNIEILAPVGGREQLTAAVLCGADAVYLGAGNFNARRNAENFGSALSLGEAVAYCHARNVKVHVTMNTLVMDSELSEAENTLQDIARAGADALIIQDLAVAEMARRRCPDIPMHASTQMAIHNVEGVKALKKLGFSRVVLARELSLEEIRAIRAATDMELEVFVHGALCMSASGLCELSAMIGGRSGNRGLCAQPCRLDFNCKGRSFALSLKDVSHITALPELVEAGVCSAKIEGRMKRPEYVAAAVTACRAALAGEPVDMDTLQAVFSRSGFTDGYLRGKRGLEMFGYRTREDVAAAPGVLKDLAGLYRAERQSVPVDMTLKIKSGEQVTLAARDGEYEAIATAGMPEEARSIAMSVEAARKNMAKTGGTQFYLRNFSAELDEGLTMPASALNSLRRQALEELAKHRQLPASKAFLNMPPMKIPPHSVDGEPRLRLRFETVKQIFACPTAELVILPVWEISANRGLISEYGERLAAELPALVYPMQEEKLRRELETLQKAGLRHAVAEGLGAIDLCRELGYTVHGGASLNILNSTALEQCAALGLHDATVSIELAMGNLRRLGGETPRGLIAYGYLPLMKFRACPAQSQTGCGKCTGLTEMTDRKNESFTIICRRRQYSELLNCVPLYIGDKAIQGADFCTLYFTTESRQKCMEAAELFASRSAPPFRRTGGLYYRELL